MSDNLKELKEVQVDFAIPLAGGVASVKTANHNPLEKDIISKLGRYTGFPFSAQRENIGIVPNGSLFWNANAMNKSDFQFIISISKNTLDGNYISRILELLVEGDLIHFKDFVGRSTTLKFIGLTEQIDAESNIYYDIVVEGFAENTNYAYQIGENEPCIIEFITNTRTLNLNDVLSSGNFAFENQPLILGVNGFESNVALQQNLPFDDDSTAGRLSICQVGSIFASQRKTIIEPGLIKSKNNDGRESTIDLTVISANRNYTTEDKDGMFIVDGLSNGKTYGRKNGNWVAIDEIRTITSATTILVTDKTINISSGTFTQPLITAIGNAGIEFEFINSGSGIITLDANGTQTINGALTLIVPAESGYKIKSDGTNWIITSKFRQQALNRTQWVQPISTTTVPNGSELQLSELISDANKLSNGTDGGIYELSISSGTILTEWKGAVMVHNIRITLNIETGSDQHYILSLKRSIDDSIVQSTQINRNVDTSICSAEFLTYTYSATDPFVTDGFYFSLTNNSGVSMDLTTDINLLISTSFR